VHPKSQLLSEGRFATPFLWLFLSIFFLNPTSYFIPDDKLTKASFKGKHNVCFSPLKIPFSSFPLFYRRKVGLFIYPPHAPKASISFRPQPKLCAMALPQHKLTMPLTTSFALYTLAFPLLIFIVTLYKTFLLFSLLITQYLPYTYYILYISYNTTRVKYNFID